MSRRLAQSTGFYEFGTVKPQIQQAERVVEGLVKKGYLKMYKLGDVVMIKYMVNAGFLQVRHIVCQTDVNRKRSIYINRLAEAFV